MGRYFKKSRYLLNFSRKLPITAARAPVENRLWPQNQFSGGFGHGEGKLWGRVQAAQGGEDTGPVLWAGRGQDRGGPMGPLSGPISDRKRGPCPKARSSAEVRSLAVVPDGNDSPGTEAISGSNDSSPDQASFTTQRTVSPYWAEARDVLKVHGSSRTIRAIRSSSTSVS